MDIEGKLIKTLGTLGKTETSIVKKLTALGIKGKKKDENFCPIANYIRLKNPSFGNRKVRVDDGVVEVFSVRPHNEVRLNNREHITKFIQNFDNGKYPHLEKKAKKK